MWKQVERFGKVPGSDGQDVVIDEDRMPARFLRLRALGGTNSMGEPVRPFVLEFGTGCERLVWQLAKEIAEGMCALGEANK